jgi:hypothetical protein
MEGERLAPSTLLRHFRLRARNVSPGTKGLFPKLGVHRLRHQPTGHSRP